MASHITISAEEFPFPKHDGHRLSSLIKFITVRLYGAILRTVLAYMALMITLAAMILYYCGCIEATVLQRTFILPLNLLITEK